MFRFGKLSCKLMTDIYVLGYDEATNTYVCPYCGKRLPYSDHTIDHVIPRNLFREYLVDREFDEIRPTVNDHINRIASCWSCNNFKRSRLYVPLLNNSIYDRLPLGWQIKFSDYFMKCFTYGRKPDSPRFFGEAGSESFKVWSTFSEAYSKLSLLGCRAIFSFPDRIDVSRFDRLIKGVGLQGNQKKWFKDGRIVKLSTHNEHIAEVLTSELLRYSDLPEDCYVRYYPCKVFEDKVLLGDGCYCESFLKLDEYEVPLSTIISKSGKLSSISYDDLIDLLCVETGFGYKDYIDRVLSVDMITSNMDRGLDGISFISNGRMLRPAPIMDNGSGCLCGTDYKEPYISGVVWESLRYKLFNNTLCGGLKSRQLIRIDAKSFLSDYGRRSVVNVPLQNAIDIIARGLAESEGKAWVQL